jgi:hydrogenase maturation protease
MNVLIAGIGNIFAGDDAFGCEVARLLMKRQLPPNVRVVDFGIRGLDLAYALMDKPDLTILLDATPQGGDPGTIYTIEPDRKDLDCGAGESLDGHSVDPIRVLRIVQTMGGELGRILLIGCEPEDLGGEEGCMGLTPVVANAAEQAADIAVSLVQKEFVEV